MSKTDKEKALWNSFHVEFSRLKHKTIPALHRGVGIADTAMQEFSLYPTRDTKEWRKRVNKWTAGAGIPRSKFQPFAEKRKVTKMKPLKGYPRADIYGAPKGRALDENEVQLRDLSSMITSLR